MQSWQQTIAEVTSTQLSGFEHASDGATGTETSLQVDVRYSYKVDGHLYRGSRIEIFDVSYGNRALAERVREKFRVGSPTTAYFNPSAPEDAVFDRRYPLVPVLPALGFGVVLLLVGIRTHHLVSWVRAAILQLR